MTSKMYIAYRALVTVLTLSVIIKTCEAKKGSDECFALALSGGGSLGAYEAGGLWGIYYTLKDKSEMEYDVVTGVSAGSINAFAVTLHEVGHEEKLVNFLSDTWAHLQTKDAW
jgi:predicted acylesterase/phospholipase RssA